MNWVDVTRRWVPRSCRYWAQRWVNLSEVKLRHAARRNPLADVTASDENRAGSLVRFGILRNAAQYHAHFVQACLELGVPFRVLDLARSDWLEQVEHSGCEVLLVWPDAFLSIWNRMIKERVQVLEQMLGYPCVPSTDEIWMYEDKCRMAYWLQARAVPHPRTWIFYDREEAGAFAARCELPVVFKTNFGAAATGVHIVRTRRQLGSLLARAFHRGLLPGGADRRDRQWGCALLQEYLPDVKEWRLVRIGDSYFGHPKGRVGDFHSGSGVAVWDVPEPRHLDLLHSVTEKGGFRSMDVDVFETLDGRLLVNELQAVFGASVAIDQCRVDGQPGRFIRAGDDGWRFEPGDFARNACANERIRDALARGLRRKR
jgi:glutathione synthase/RimK-type ligase-like ATP-grasp enzyme